MTFAKRFILDVSQGADYASGIYTAVSIRAIRSVGYYCYLTFDIFHHISCNIVHVQIHVDPPT